MRVLCLTHAWPNTPSDVAGIFVRRQVESLRALGVTVEVRVVGRSGGKGWHRAIADLRRELKQGAYDLVHAQYGGRTALAAVLVSRRPVVISYCGTDLNGLATGSAAARAYTGVGVLSSQLAAPRASGLIAKSAALASRFWKPRDRQRCHVIPNGIDMELFRPIERQEARTRLGWPPDGAFVLVSGQSAGPVKRLDLARSVVERAREGLPGLSMKLLRGVPPDEVPLYLNAADVLLLTSQHEGSPNIVKEALACNLSVVSVDVGDVARWIGGTPGCWLCDRSSTTLAEALLHAIRAGGRSHGREAIASLSLQGVAAQVLEVYAEALKYHARH